MSIVGQLYPVVILTAVSVAVLLRFMMLEFNYHGLSFLAVVLGLAAVGVLQMSGHYMHDKIDAMPEPKTYW